MELSNKKNMALKLELWLSAKQSGGSAPAPSPLKQTALSTTALRRVSGLISATSTASSVEGSPRSRRKSFLRVLPPGDEDSRKKVPSGIRVSTSPSKGFTRDVLESPLSSNTAQCSVFLKDSSDENSKENHPWHDQNVTPIVVRQKLTKMHSPLVVSKSAPSSDSLFKGSKMIERRLTISDLRPDLSASESDPEYPSHHQYPLSDLDIPIESLNEGSSRAEQIEFCDTNPGGLEKKALLLEEELHAMMFLNSILEQRINELEQAISQDRLESNEAVSNRGKKHKAELKRLAAERSSYEERAHQMISQVTEQMAQLQNMAMGRIEVLENDLLEERHGTEALKQEVANLKSVISKNQIIKGCNVEDSADINDVLDGSSYSETDSIAGTEEAEEVQGSVGGSDADDSTTDIGSENEEEEEDDVDDVGDVPSLVFPLEGVFNPSNEENEGVCSSETVPLVADVNVEVEVVNYW